MAVNEFLSYVIATKNGRVRKGFGNLTSAIFIVILQNMDFPDHNFMTYEELR